MRSDLGGDSSLSEEFTKPQRTSSTAGPTRQRPAHDQALSIPRKALSGHRAHLHLLLNLLRLLRSSSASSTLRLTTATGPKNSWIPFRAASPQSWPCLPTSSIAANNNGVHFAIEAACLAKQQCVLLSRNPSPSTTSLKVPLYELKPPSIPVETRQVLQTKIYSKFAKHQNQHRPF